MTAPPNVTIVIPIYNEEGILRVAIVDLIDRLQHLPFTYEVLLAENGSRDGTVRVCEELAGRYKQLRHFSIGRPGEGNYGLALRTGIGLARGQYVFCDEIDLCDTDFHHRAFDVLQAGEADLVIGSKLAAGAKDERPFVRHVGSVVINGMLKVALGFQGTDTHGLKAFRRAAVMPVVDACVVDKDLFASELVIRAERAAVSIKEIPVRVKEMREPQIHLFRRVPNVLRNLARLVVAIRFKG